MKSIGKTTKIANGMVMNTDALSIMMTMEMLTGMTT